MSTVGVPDEQVVEDYAATEQFLTPAFRKRLERTAMPAHIDEQAHAVMLVSPPSMMRGVLGTIATRHGSAADYLLHSGLSSAQMQALQRALVAPHAA